MNDGRQLFPTSFAQERLWFLDQLAPGTPLYNLSIALPFKGALDVGALEQALREIVRRHEALRTTFTAQQGRSMQAVHADGSVTLAIVDLRAMPAERRQREGERVVRAEAERPYDLATGPLLRATLLRFVDDDAILLLGMHHIVSDGWSMEVLRHELATLYAAYAAGHASPLPALPVQYADYAVWQREQLAGPALDAQLAYWKAQLEGAPALMELPADRPRPAVQSFRGASQACALPAELTSALRALGREEGATPFMVLLAGFQALLARYTGRADPVVGTPVANRTRPETEGLIGFFVNTLVLRGDLRGRPSLREAIRRARELVLAAHDHQDLPFERLVAELAPERHLSHSPLMQVMFVYQASVTEAMDDGVPLDAAAGEPPEVERGGAKFDLTLFVGEAEGRLTVLVEYATDLFDDTRMRRLLEHYVTFLAAGAAEPERPLAELPLVGEREREWLVRWGEGARVTDAATSVTALFAAQASARPDAVALVAADGGTTSYGELAARATELAECLAAHGAGLGRPVAVYLERSPALVTALLATLRTGAAYLPLETREPPARLARALADCDAAIVVTTRELAARLPLSHGAHVLHVDSCGAPIEEREVRGVIEAGVEPDAETPAYVMYTSGSTGRPKGVVVPHRGIIRLARGTCAQWFGPDDVALLLAPASFDAATLEIWGPLLNGGKLVIPPHGMPSPERLGGMLREHGITTLWLTSSLFHQVVEQGVEELRTLRTLLVGGDVLSVPHVARFLREAPACRLVNGYGPTENTTFTTCHPITGADELAHGVPIGKPIAGTYVRILDEHRQLVPTGIPGELYAGGDGLALGYLGQPELTAERFVADPFATAPGARLYRTGDLARWREDGVLEFLGRRDHQVKVRGYRIELGEIEAALGRMPEVRACVVVARNADPEGARLMAYVVPAGDEAVTSGELRRQLQAELPDYMVPNLFVVLDALPLTAAGKVDREKLPAPGVQRPALDEAFVAPASELEGTIGRVWREVLGLERVGVHDNFFDLGGHSLLMVRAHRRIETALRVSVPLVELFRHPTVHALSAYVARLRTTPSGADAGIAPESLSQLGDRAERQREARARRRARMTLGEAEP